MWRSVKIKGISLYVTAKCTSGSLSVLRMLFEEQSGWAVILMIFREEQVPSSFMNYYIYIIFLFQMFLIFLYIEYWFHFDSSFRLLALEVERNRAAKVAALPKPKPNPADYIEPVKCKSFFWINTEVVLGRCFVNFCFDHAPHVWLDKNLYFFINN